MRFLKIRLLVTLAVTTLLMAAAGHLVQAQYVPPGPNGLLVFHIKSNAVAFPQTSEGTTAAPLTILAQNVGTAPLTVGDGSLTGPDAGDFSFSDTCGSLDVNQFCTFTFTFAPSAKTYAVRRADLRLTASSHPVEIIVPVVGIAAGPDVPIPVTGPMDPRVGYPLYYSDGFTTLELCLDNKPPNDANGNPLPQIFDVALNMWTPTLCLGGMPDPLDANRPPSMTYEAATTHWPGEAFWWSAEAELTPAGWKRARLIMAQEAANELNLPGEQWAFGRLRLRADDVPAGTYAITHPFGRDIVTVAVGDDRIFETSDIGCFNLPCDFDLALNTRIKRFLTCEFAPYTFDGIQYIGDPNTACRIKATDAATRIFKIDLVDPEDTNVVLETLGQTDLFFVAGKIRSQVVQPPSDPVAPVANPDTAFTVGTAPVTIDVLANDSDANPLDVISIQSVSIPANGTATIDNGMIVYQANEGFIGDETFSYTIVDSSTEALTASAIVTVTVGTHDRPAATDDTFTLNIAPFVQGETVVAPPKPQVSSLTDGAEGQATSILANDINNNPDVNSVLTFTLVSSSVVENPLTPGLPKLTLNADGSFLYELGAGLAQPETVTFTYTVNDGVYTSLPGTVTINIPRPVGQPNAVEDVLVAPREADMFLDVDVNDTNGGAPGGGIGRGPAFWVVSPLPAGTGTLAVVNQPNPDGTANRKIRFRPAAAFQSGVITFSYMQADAAFWSNFTTVTLTVTAPVPNNLPVANPDTATTAFGVPVTVQVLLNDTDADLNDVLVVIGAGDAVGGSVAVNDLGTAVVFTPAPGFSGNGSFSYQLSDGKDTVLGSVTVTVAAQEVATITSPAAGSTAPQPLQFAWSTVTGADAYVLHVGTSDGAFDVAALFVTQASAVVNTAPSGVTLHARVFARVAGEFIPGPSITFTAAAPAVLTSSLLSPASGEAVSAPHEFTWTVADGAEAYVLHVGTSDGAFDVAALFVQNGTSVTVTEPLAPGATYFARVWSLVNGVWHVGPTTSFTGQ
jgi:hypothetical protein